MRLLQSPGHPRTRPYAVVIFGRTGVGISSLVNLIVGHPVSSNHDYARPHTAWFSDKEFSLYEMPGFGGAIEDKAILQSIHQIERDVGIDLFIYCFRKQKATLLPNIVRLIRNSAPGQRASMIAVVTELERFRPEMDKWWDVVLGGGKSTNGTMVEQVCFGEDDTPDGRFNAHACITTLPRREADLVQTLQKRRKQSEEQIRNLIQEHCRKPKRAPNTDPDPLLGYPHDVKEVIYDKLRRSDPVLPNTESYSKGLSPVTEVQEGMSTARKPTLEPKDMSSVKEYNNNETLRMTIGATQSNLLRDLTGQVTKSSTYPFASGGFGDIYKGNLNVGGRSIDVAIKTTRVYLQNDQDIRKKVKQFRREVSVWSKLSHPNVLPLLGIISDASIHPDIPAMVCPWIENGALSSYLETNRLTLANKVFLINDVAHGLQYLHSQSIVHGDLSGSNILVTEDGRACIADFGLSTLLTQLSQSTFATTHQGKGTVRWMAPELLEYQNDSQVIPTTKTDVYSFGSIVLQILTGDIPYHYLSRNEQVILAIARGMTPRRPDEEVVTDHWWTFIEWCWSPVNAAKPRPSSDEVLGFIGQELATVAGTEFFSRGCAN